MKLREGWGNNFSLCNCFVLIDSFRASNGSDGRLNLGVRF
jgi:hypothetical protein